MSPEYKADTDCSAPKESGWYLARFKSFGWYHLLIEVWGTIPMLHVHSVYDMHTNKVGRGLEDLYDVVWGPLLHWPQVSKEDIAKFRQRQGLVT
jgi:hypothetical protein